MPVSTDASQYERIKLLGKGTFGKAWRVRDKTSRDEFVAKEIKVENKQDLEDALAEARVLSQLNHFNIVKYKDVIRNSPKLVTIVMEYCDDGELAEKIARRKFRSSYFDEATVQFWFVQTTMALNYLHQQGILHRDVKTANLFLTKAGNIKLGDFGIARILDRNAEVASQRTTKTPVGTPMYMSPEICTGSRYGQKADIWALGCVLYEMASLRPAFMAYSMESLMAKIKRGHHDKHLPRHYSSELRMFIPRLLQVDPRKRLTSDEILKIKFFAAAVSRAEAVASGGSGVTVSEPEDKVDHKPQVMVIESQPSVKIQAPGVSQARNKSPRMHSPRLRLGGLRGQQYSQQQGKSPLGQSPVGTPVSQRRGTPVGTNWYSNQKQGQGNGYRGRWR